MSTRRDEEFETHGYHPQCQYNRQKCMYKLIYKGKSLQALVDVVVNDLSLCANIFVDAKHEEVHTNQLPVGTCGQGICFDFGCSTTDCNMLRHKVQ